MARQRTNPLKSAGDKEAAEEGLRVPLHWTGADEVPILMANHLFVRFIDGQFLVSIGQTHGPYELSETPEAQEKLAREGIDIRTIVRFSLSPEKMRDFAKALHAIFGRFEQELLAESDKVRLKRSRQ